MDDILKVTGLNKSYDNFSLKDVSFTLPEGCITGFIGVNGAGKTTTLRSILGLTSRISGHINFFGMYIEKDARKIKDRIGVVLDNAELLIMDEPTSGLDPLIRGQLLTILTDYMSNGGKGVFFSTHITSDLDKIADMLILIDNGRIVFQEEKDTLLDSYRIVKGDMRKMDENIRKLFLRISETAYGFTGITQRVSEVQQYIPDIII